MPSIKSCILFLNILILSSSKKEDLCQACKDLKANILQSLKDTENSTYQGGTSYQNDPIGDFKTSEIRFITIIEQACPKNDKKRTCNYFMEKYEDTIKEWFDQQHQKEVDFFDFVCVQEAQVCCPEYHYGKKCDICKGFVGEVLCSRHGSCSGSGTRKGNGSCICHTGYGGEICASCATGYVNIEGNCIECHESCRGECANDTADGCLTGCKKGWAKSVNGTCVDVDECSSDRHDCKSGRYCENNVGGFECKKCDSSCRTCNKAGNGGCLECQDGFQMSDDHRCLDINECHIGEPKCKEDELCVNKPGNFTCKKCHKACEGGCTSMGLYGCVDCKPGYIKSETGHGCVDYNECQEDNDPCPNNKYCFNVEGTFRCKNCDEACDGCRGPGPYSCVSCSQGHEMIDGICVESAKMKKLAEEEEMDDEDEL